VVPEHPCQALLFVEQGEVQLQVLDAEETPSD